MKTKRGVYQDISESDYYYDLDGVRYYFSSEFNLERYKTRVKDYVNNEIIKLKYRFKINCSFDLYFQLAFYKRIEKRGFKVVELSSNRSLSKDITIINTIV